MDEIDRKILSALQANARVKKSTLARELNMPATTLQERIRKLEERGVITGYQAVIDPAKLDLKVQAFVAVILDSHGAGDIRRFETGIKTISNIKACYHLSGRFDYLLHVTAEDLTTLGDLVKTRFTALPDFGRCETFLVFSEMESNRNWPLQDLTDILEK